jgi:hypothetical protein
VQALGSSTLCITAQGTWLLLLLLLHAAAFVVVPVLLLAQPLR